MDSETRWTAMERLERIEQRLLALEARSPGWSDTLREHDDRLSKLEQSQPALAPLTCPCCRAAVPELATIYNTDKQACARCYHAWEVIDGWVAEDDRE